MPLNFIAVSRRMRRFVYSLHGGELLPSADKGRKNPFGSYSLRTLRFSVSFALLFPCCTVIQIFLVTQRPQRFRKDRKEPLTKYAAGNIFKRISNFTGK